MFDEEVGVVGLVLAGRCEAWFSQESDVSVAWAVQGIFGLVEKNMEAVGEGLCIGTLCFYHDHLVVLQGPTGGIIAGGRDLVVETGEQERLSRLSC